MSALEKEHGYGGKMDRKGQVTLFIIIGVVLLMLIALIFFIVRSQEAIKAEQKELPTIRHYIENCIEEVSYDAAYLLGQQGGYIYFGGQPVYTDEIVAAYHYYEGEDVTPTRQDMQNHISAYVVVNMNRCLDDFRAYRRMNMNIRTGDMEAETLIGINEFVVKLNYPVTYTSEGQRMTIEEFNVIIPVRLGYIRSVVKEMAEKRIDLPRQTDLEFISRFDVEITIRYMGDRNILFEIIDPKSTQERRGDYLFNTLARLIP